jgi:hypothetical protein
LHTVAEVRKAGGGGKTPLILSPTTPSKIQDLFHAGVVLQAKGSILIFCFLQQQYPKENPFCKWVSRKKDTQI